MSKIIIDTKTAEKAVASRPAGNVKVTTVTVPEKSASDTVTEEPAPVVTDDAATDIDATEEMDAVSEEGTAGDEMAAEDGAETAIDAEEASDSEEVASNAVGEAIADEGMYEMADGAADGGMYVEPGFDEGMIVDPGMGMGMPEVKDPLLSSWFFVIGISAAVLVVSVGLGALLARRRIKKGIDLYED